MKLKHFSYNGWIVSLLSQVVIFCSGSCFTKSDCVCTGKWKTGKLGRGCTAIADSRHGCNLEEIAVKLKRHKIVDLSDRLVKSSRLYVVIVIFPWIVTHLSDVMMNKSEIKQWIILLNWVLWMIHYSPIQKALTALESYATAGWRYSKLEINQKIHEFLLNID